MMPSGQLSSAIQDFYRARQRAAMQAVLSRLTGKSVALLSYNEVLQHLKSTGSSERGVHEIPLAAIVGSVGRYTDFTRDFLPTHDALAERWARIKTVVGDPNSAMPPIEVYQIGEAYFVADGHHRVSVARELGATSIEAYVTEVRTKVPLSPETQPDDLILMAEKAEFLETTGLDRLRPEADLTVSAPGQYATLENHIEVHRYFLEVEQGREVPYEEAVTRWYDDAYMPVVLAIRDQGLLRNFPGRTETDLYLWVVEHRMALQEELGWDIKPEAALGDLAARFGSRPQGLARVGRSILNVVGLTGGPAPGEWRKEKFTARYLDRLFADVLVPLSGEPASWQALEQALVVARREGARLQGLHIIPGEAQKQSQAARAVQAEFVRRCEAASVSGSLALEVGDSVSGRICERAVLADLVVLHLAHPPGSQPLARLSSGFGAVVRRSARPVLAVPGPASALQRVLLAYDRSPKAEEAMFVAAYLAELWKSHLTVVTVLETGHATSDTLAHAREYLEWHEVSADYVLKDGGQIAPTILQMAEERGSELIIIGGYTASPMREVMLGSAVDEVLRRSRWPVLICR
jgi:nucleotide-binding universal stress UspA family protein